jgi:2-polyprenyl-6-methoxyphenol hydroxylase-like FAD-dependent oxidoreductase
MNNTGNILISGASFAGLATAFWMKKFGYQVTVVEISENLKKGGTPVNIREGTVDIAKRMGLFDQIEAKRVRMESMEIVNCDGTAQHSTEVQAENEESGTIDYEIERDTLLNIMFDAVKGDVEFIFDEGITSLEETNSGITVSFKKGKRRAFDLVFGCDGVRSDLRRYWFGADQEYSHFLESYGSVTVLDKLLIKENTSQVYIEPGKYVQLSAYNNKTDIILIFSSEKEIPYDYRDTKQKQKILQEQFSGVGWRVAELMQEVKKADDFYFGGLYQIKMPSWTKGRVALVGDAGYCASPAAGRGGSLAIDGAAALADAFEKSGGDYQAAFQEYNRAFRPFVEQIQHNAVEFGLTFLLPKTAEAILERQK